MIDYIRRAYQGWSEDDGSLLAAAVAYYLALSFFPLLLVLLSALGFFFQWAQSGHDAESQILLTIQEQFSPTLSSYVATVFSQVREKASIGGPIGLLTLLAAALALFTQFEQAFDRIWNVPSQSRSFLETIRHLLLERAKAFAMLMALGVVILAVFFCGLVISAILDAAGVNDSNNWLRWAAQLSVASMLNLLVFTLIYRYVPKAKVTWKSAAAGGLFAAVIWEIGRLVLSAVLIGKKYSAYGVVGAFLAIMLWTYYAVSVIFFGAEFARAVSGKQRSTAASTDS